MGELVSRRIVLGWVIPALLLGAVACAEMANDDATTSAVKQQSSQTVLAKDGRAPSGARVGIPGLVEHGATRQTSAMRETVDVRMSDDTETAASPSVPTQHEDRAPVSTPPATQATAPEAMPTASPAKPSAAEIVAAQEEVFTDLYAATLPSVVHIGVRRVVQGQLAAAGEGSGFVWDSDGVVVTNNHVVDGASEVLVTFEDGNVFRGEIIGTDSDSDLAAIRIDAPEGYLKPVSLGDSNDLKVGQLAFALGNPFGKAFTMTNGIISALDRTIPGSSNSSYHIPSAIQTDAPINPGNSGGPLFDVYGNVIGINSQIISRSGTSAGVGFAIPVNIAKIVVPALTTTGSHTYTYIGIVGTNVTSMVAEAYGLDRDIRGSLILDLVGGGPADDAGLRGEQETRRGDIITAIDGVPVITIEDLMAYLAENTKPGQTVTVDVIRADDSAERVDVILEPRPAS